MRFLRLLLVIFAVSASFLFFQGRAQPVLAAHHSAEISEVMSGFNGDPNVQFVEINLIGAGQTLVADTRLTVFNANGSFNTVLLNPLGSNVTNSTQFIMGTTAFQIASGLTPDFIMPTGILPSAGMVCWGAPGAVAPPPATWMASDATKYVDCVSYGGASFTGTNPMSPTAHSAGAGDGVNSLTRIVASTGKSSEPWRNSNDATDFALQPPSPKNNAGQVGTLTAVGGIAELPEVAEAPLAQPDSSSVSAGVLAAVVVAAAVAMLTLAGAAWYARRRLSE